MSERTTTPPEVIVHRVQRIECRVQVDIAMPHELWEADEGSEVAADLGSKVIRPAADRFLKAVGFPYLLTVTEGEEES